MNKNKKILEQRIKNWVKKLASIGPFIEGTLAVTGQMCARETCACRRGKKHESMFLTWKEDRKTRSLYIPVARHKEALAMNKNYKKLKKIIRRISDLQKQLLTLKKSP